MPSWSPKQFDCFGERRKRGDLNGRSPFIVASRFRRWQFASLHTPFINEDYTRIFSPEHTEEFT